MIIVRPIFGALHDPIEEEENYKGHVDRKKHEPKYRTTEKMSEGLHVVWNVLQPQIATH